MFEGAAGRFDGSFSNTNFASSSLSPPTSQSTTSTTTAPISVKTSSRSQRQFRDSYCESKTRFFRDLSNFCAKHTYVLVHILGESHFFSRPMPSSHISTKISSRLFFLPCQLFCRLVITVSAYSAAAIQAF